MNPRTEHCDVMVHSREDDLQDHPYWYARILGIFHVRVLHTGPAATNRSIQNMEFVLVRWFGRAPDHHSGVTAARLPKIGFVEDNDELADLVRDCVRAKAPAHGINTVEFIRPERAMYQIGG